MTPETTPTAPAFRFESNPVARLFPLNPANVIEYQTDTGHRRISDRWRMIDNEPRPAYPVENYVRGYAMANPNATINAAIDNLNAAPYQAACRGSIAVHLTTPGGCFVWLGVAFGGVNYRVLYFIENRPVTLTPPPPAWLSPNRSRMTQSEQTRRRDEYNALLNQYAAALELLAGVCRPVS